MAAWLAWPPGGALDAGWFLLLLLAYVGSKFVLEVLLHCMGDLGAPVLRKDHHCIRPAGHVSVLMGGMPIPDANDTAESREP